MGTKNQPGTFDCYSKAEPDEPLFTLLARDPLAPQLVRLWSDLTRSKEKVNEALACADAMESWRKRKVATQ